MKKYFLNFLLFSLALIQISCSSNRLEETIYTSVLNSHLYEQETPKFYATKVEPQYNNYQLNSKGLQPGERYSLYVINVKLIRAKIDDFIVSPQGDLISVTQHVPLRRCHFTLDNFMNGEPCYYSLTTADEQTCFTTQIHPNPIEYKWKDEAYVSLNMITKEACSFIFAGRGFEPGETLIITSKIGKETTSRNLVVQPEGTCYFAQNFSDPESSGGIGVMTIQRSNVEESGTLKFYWGTFASRYIDQKIK